MNKSKIIPKREPPKRTPMLATKYQQNLAHLGKGQNRKTVLRHLDPNLNGLGFVDQPKNSIRGIGLIKDSNFFDDNTDKSGQHSNIQKQLNIGNGSSLQTIVHLAIESFLVFCIAIVFVLWTSAGLYEHLTTGNSTLLFVEALQLDLFKEVALQYLDLDRKSLTH